MRSGTIFLMRSALLHVGKPAERIGDLPSAYIVIECVALEIPPLRVLGDVGGKGNLCGRVFPAAVYVFAEGGEFVFILPVGKVHRARVFIGAVYFESAPGGKGCEFFRVDGRGEVVIAVRKTAQRVAHGAARNVQRKIRSFRQQAQFFGYI